MRIIIGIFLGSAFSGGCLALVSYFATINDAGGGGFLGSNSEWWPFAVLTDFVVGGLIGGIAGLIITGLGLDLIKAVMFGLCLNVLIAVILYEILGGAPLDMSINYPLLALVPIGVINGVLISLLLPIPESLA